MRIVIAPDSFKESLSATEVASAMAAGVLSVLPAAEVDLCPMADGGEGTVEAMVSATGGQYLSADVFGPLGAPTRARLGLLGRPVAAALPGELGLAAAVARADGEGGAAGAGGTAVVEMAAASGLALVGPEMRDPMRTTTFGTGRLILAALDAGADEIIVGLGGSATVDGGCGCAQALGVVFLDSAGEMIVCGMGGGDLASVARVDVTGRDGRLANVRLRVACDVTNPLIGPLGAAAVFAPQKGATPEMVLRLEAGLANLAEVIRRDLGLDVSALPGGGAAGGLAAGLVAFAGGVIESGVELIAAAVDLDRRLASADLCITGEGRLDAQSRAGKTACGVARAARAAATPVACVCGSATDDAPLEMFDDVRPLVCSGVTARQAMAKPAALISERTAAAVRSMLARRAEHA